MKRYSIVLIFITILLTSCGNSLENLSYDQLPNVGTSETVGTSIGTSEVYTTNTIDNTITTTAETDTTTTTTAPIQTTTQETSTTPLSYGFDDEQLLTLAQSLHTIACEMYWNYYYGSPYSVDYSNYIEDSVGTMYFLIDDENINSLEDVQNDWYEIFSKRNLVTDFDGHYIEQDGKVYINEASKGADVYYTNTEISEISSRTEDEIYFNAVSHYTDPADNTIQEDQTYKFSIVLEDGSYHVGEFTLPY